MAVDYNNPYAQELAGIERNRALATALMSNQQQPQGQVISGRYVAPSFAQQLAPIANTLTGSYISGKADEKAVKTAQQLRDLYAKELKTFSELQKEDPRSANLYGAGAYNPVLQTAATKQLMEAPEWKEAKIPQPDGTELFGYVNVKAPNPISTFIQGGSKPAISPVDVMKGGWEGWYNPKMMPASGAPTGNVSVTGAPTGGQPVVGGTSRPISASSTPTMTSTVGMPFGGGMSGSVRNEANKQLFVEDEKVRREALRNLPTDINRANQAIATIDEMLGGAKVNPKASFGWETPKGATEPHKGFGQYVGVGIPFLSNMHGTDTAGFRTLYDSLKGQAFLEAFQRIKGAGAITEVEGAKATQALLKLNNAQNESEFIKYAREFQDNLRTGMELAKQKAGVRSSPSMPRWNPKTQNWE